MQDLKHCLVQIFDKLGNPCGSGFLVQNRWILTCGHVVKNIPTENDKVLVRFYSDMKLELVADIHSLFQVGRGDLALLELGNLPPDNVNSAFLAAKVPSECEFTSWGYPQYWNDKTAYADIQVTEGKCHKYDQDVGEDGDLRLSEVAEITSGYSGAPIFTRGIVIGMIRAFDRSDRYGRNPQSAWGISVKRIYEKFPFLKDDEEPDKDAYCQIALTRVVLQRLKRYLDKDVYSSAKQQTSRKHKNMQKLFKRYPDEEPPCWEDFFDSMPQQQAVVEVVIRCGLPRFYDRGVVRVLSSDPGFKCEGLSSRVPLLYHWVQDSILSTSFVQKRFSQGENRRLPSSFHEWVRAGAHDYVLQDQVDWRRTHQSLARFWSHPDTRNRYQWESAINAHYHELFADSEKAIVNIVADFCSRLVGYNPDPAQLDELMELAQILENASKWIFNQETRDQIAFWEDKIRTLIDRRRKIFKAKNRDGYTSDDQLTDESFLLSMIIEEFWKPLSQARNIFSKLEPNLRNDIWEHIGELYGQIGRSEDALDAYAQAGNQSSTWLGKARAHFNLEKYPQALDCFSAALSRKPTTEIQIESYIGRGKAWREKQELEKAIEDFQLAKTLAPRNGIAWLEEARAYFLLAQLTDVKTDYDHPTSVLKLTPSKMEQLSESKSSYERAIKMEIPKGECISAYRELATVSEYLGDSQSVIEALNAVLDMLEDNKNEIPDTDLADIYFSLTVASHHLGDKDSMITYASIYIDSLLAVLEESDLSNSELANIYFSLFITSLQLNGNGNVAQYANDYMDSVLKLPWIVQVEELQKMTLYRFVE